MNDMDKHAKALLEPTMDLIHQVLRKHTRTVLGEMKALVQRTKAAEQENAELRRLLLAIMPDQPETQTGAAWVKAVREAKAFFGRG